MAENATDIFAMAKMSGRHYITFQFQIAGVLKNSYQKHGE
jgi:hypothetical protein